MLKLETCIKPETYLKKDSKGGSYALYSVGEFRDALEKDIYAFKSEFDGCKDLGRIFGEYIYGCIYKDQLVYFELSLYDYLLPIPSRPSSLTKRGYDPVGLIGERLSELCELPLAKDILNVSDGDRQMGLSADKRCKNIKGAFSLINSSRVEGKSFLVLDDVFTTGSTMAEVIGTLNTADPCHLDALVLAKVPYDPSQY